MLVALLALVGSRDSVPIGALFFFKEAIVNLQTIIPFIRATVVIYSLSSETHLGCLRGLLRTVCRTTHFEWQQRANWEAKAHREMAAATFQPLFVHNLCCRITLN